MNDKSFEKLFASRNPNYVFLLKRMQKALGVKEVTFADITTDNLRTFKHYMENLVSANSLCTYMAVVKASIKECAFEGMIDNPHCVDVLKVKKTPVQNTALTEEELIKFDEYVPRTQTERDVKILFMRGAFSGARSCDCAVMSRENASNGLLTYVSKKTKVGVVQPIHKRLQKYLDMQPAKIHDRTVVNRCIQDICKRLGFTEPVTLSRGGKLITKPKYEWVTHHSSRRSFATSLAVRGVPVETIAKLCGHEDSSTTSSHYICIDTKNIGSEAMAFFNA